MSDKTGGPAFPQQFHMSPRLDQGMTLRDYFAAKAVPGLVADSGHDYEWLSRKAYQMADAMLKERAK